MSADRQQSLTLDQALERLRVAPPREFTLAEVRAIAPHLPAFIALGNGHPMDIGITKRILSQALIESPAAGEIVRRLITDPDETVRAAAIGAVGWAGEAGRACGAAIYAALKDRSPVVREEATKALGRINWETAWRDLDKASEQEGRAGSLALTALSGLETVNALPALEDALRRHAPGDDEWHTAAAAIGGFGARARGSLELLEPFCSHADPQVCGWARLACFQIDPSESRLEALTGHYRSQLGSLSGSELRSLLDTPLYSDSMAVLDVLSELELRHPHFDALLLDILEPQHLSLHEIALQVVDELGASGAVQDKILGSVLRDYSDRLDQFDLDRSGRPSYVTGSNKVACAMLAAAALFPRDTRVHEHIDRIRGMGVYLISEQEGNMLADLVIEIESYMEDPQ